jgi:diaminohydroxyphosphoribosylaminopyrimidine deaminase/5-amino-6-(5-phosphoribosylamino)uracil reductase
LALFSAAGAKNKEKKAANHFFIDEDEHGLDLKKVLKKLGSLGIASLLVEGGGSIINSFLAQGLYDEIILFTAGKLIGGKEAVELFSSGAALNRAVNIKRKEIIEFASGYLVRGYRI